MRLTYIKIQNFRSIECCEINLRDYTSLIGPNNSGKSTVLRAIEMFLNQSKPEIDDWRKDKNITVTDPVVIEGLFEEIQNWERDTPGVAGIVYNGKIRLRQISTQVEDEKKNIKIESKFEAFLKEETIQGWSDKWAELSENLKEIARACDVNNGTDWRNVGKRERVKQEIRLSYSQLIQYGDENWTDKGISIDAALKQAIPQAIIVPAVRDASDDTKPNASSSFGTLMKQVIIPAIEASDEYEGLRKAVNALSDKIRGKDDQQLEIIRTITDELSKRMSSIIETRVLVNLDPPDTNKFLGTSTTVRIDDGIETPIHLQGHGVQRSLIFALIELIAKREAAVIDSNGKPSRQKATVLLFEEPELYMHPHLMRRLKHALIGISKSDNWQVIITTHSPFLLDVANDPLSLVIFQRSGSRENRISQLKTDPFIKDDESRDDRMALRASLDFHPTVAEAFFAERVVLVEGDTELAVFRHSDKLLSLTNIDKRKCDNTSVVSCGGKWTIPSMAKLLSDFGIPFRVIHDLDRKGKSNDELEKLPPIHPYRANERIRQASNGAEIHIVEDTFEHILWNPTECAEMSTSIKPYRAWKRTEELCDGKENLDHVPMLRDILQFVFDWN